jgi:hypothetical protein
MKFTNKLGLPLSLYNAISTRFGKEHRGGEFTASSFSKSVRQHLLLKRHKDEIVQDVADLYKAWMGSVIHEEIERYEDKAEMAEEYLEMEICGTKVTGTADCLAEVDGDFVIYDYKTAPVFKIMKGDHDDWALQLNVYRCLFWDKHIDVKNLYIIALLNDWKPNEVFRNKEYPKTPAVKIEIPVWDIEKTLEKISAYILSVYKHDKEEDNDLPECNDKELWARGEAWAVMKEGRKTAVKVFKKEDGYEQEDAEVYAQRQGDKHYVEHRHPKVNRCLYCNARGFCNQYRRLDDEGYIEGVAPSMVHRAKSSKPYV